MIQGGDADRQRSEQRARASRWRRSEGISCVPGAGRTAISVSSSPATRTRSTTGPTSTPRRIRDFCARATTPFRAAGLGRPCYPVLGDHDVLVAGEIAPTDLTRALAIGRRAVWDLPHGLTLPQRLRTQRRNSPDGPPDPACVDLFLRTCPVGPDGQRPGGWVPARAVGGRGHKPPEECRRPGTGRPASPPAAGPRLDYTLDVGPHLRLVVLDLVRRGGGSGGMVARRAGQRGWPGRWRSAGSRWVIVVSHQPLTSSTGGVKFLALLDRSPRVIAALSGHTHRNSHPGASTAAGGYWLISTASLIDYPQQARALTADRDRRRRRGHPDAGCSTTSSRASSARSRGSSAYIDAQGGRPDGFAGTRLDRNVTLYRRATG